MAQQKFEKINKKANILWVQCPAGHFGLWVDCWPTMLPLLLSKCQYLRTMSSKELMWLSRSVRKWTKQAKISQFRFHARQNFFSLLFSPPGVSSGWIQTLQLLIVVDFWAALLLPLALKCQHIRKMLSKELEVMWLSGSLIKKIKKAKILGVQCPAGQNFFLCHFLILVSAAARFEASNFGLWVDCWPTMLLLLP